MLLRKATDATEAGAPLAPAQARALDALLAEMKEAGVLLVYESLAPSARGKRVKRAGTGKAVVLDGPFAESKELLGGYVLLETASLDDAVAIATEYIEAVGPPSVDVRVVDEPVSGGRARA